MLTHILFLQESTLNIIFIFNPHNKLFKNRFLSQILYKVVIKKLIKHYINI